MATLAKLSDDGDALYQQLCDAAKASPEGARKVFFQSDVQTLADSAAKTVLQLLNLLQELQSHALLRASRLQGALCWSTRPRAAADAISGLPTNERTIYEYVEDAHTKGIWQKEVKKRSGIEEQKVQRALGKLEGARLVKVVKNVRAPAQKTYMLFHLVPSDDVTGGSFFDAGDLDESLIEEVGNLIVFHVRMCSWVESKVRRPKRDAPSPDPVSDHDADTAAGAANPASPSRKRKRGTADIEDDPALRRGKPGHHATESVVVQLAWPAYSRDYPTAGSIHNFITTTDAIRASKAAQLTVAEIQGVIDVLVWDDKLEKVGSGYRTVRGVDFKPPGLVADEDDEDDEDADGEGGDGNGLTQVPCGKCPVFELCGDAGPVTAGGCEYFGEWLSAGG
ncbi:34-kDa subunit of RNA polymerase III (C) [Teratosphaeriaceae sp. CCFEE 6253]|nr:34-kDa subunit of RNA polymerase III (C) [Teratosphaeriaceae sp. CCFEE 6253]